MTSSDQPAIGQAAESTEISTPDVTRMVRRWIRRKRPAAIVRFGEGEGRLMAADASDALSVRVAARKVRRQTGRLPHPNGVFEIQGFLFDAFDRADIVGIRADASFDEEHLMWANYVGDAYAERARLRTQHSFVAHCLFNAALRDALPDLLEGQERITLISCRDLKARFTDDFGIRDVRVLQIPSQHIVRGVDDDYEAAMYDTPMWPDAYRRVTEELTVREPGEVVLIGAGLFAKSMCVQIKDLGGIGVDMGSSLDTLAGKITRGGKRPPPTPPQ